MRALDAVSMTILAGEVHALVGENGAGKSTLVKILSGVEQPDGGEMLLNGQPYVARGPQDALAAGIRVVYQELNLLTYLTIEENLSFEHLPAHRGLVDRRELRRRAEELLEEVGLDVPPDTPVEELGIAQMQMVEIARALLTDAKLLDPRRADGDADTARGGPPLRDHPPARGPGHRRPLHLPPPRRDEGDRRPRHGPAQRPVGGHTRRGPGHGGGGHRAHGRPRHGGGLPVPRSRSCSARSS